MVNGGSPVGVEEFLTEFGDELGEWEGIVVVVFLEIPGLDHAVGQARRNTGNLFVRSDPLCGKVCEAPRLPLVENFRCHHARLRMGGLSTPSCLNSIVLMPISGDCMQCKSAGGEDPMRSDGDGDVIRSSRGVQCVRVTGVVTAARCGAVLVTLESGVSGEDVPTSCHSSLLSAIRLISEGNSKGGGVGDEDEERNLFLFCA